MPSLIKSKVFSLFLLSTGLSKFPEILKIKNVEIINKTVSAINGVYKDIPIKRPAIGAPKKLFVTSSTPNNLPLAFDRKSFSTICGRNDCAALSLVTSRIPNVKANKYEIVIIKNFA